jgi:hypothetical protein
MNMKASSILLHGTKTVCFGTDYLELFSSYLEDNMDIYAYATATPWWQGFLHVVRSCMHILP